MSAKPPAVFGVTPKPAMLRGERAMKWFTSGAAAELADNSFGPGRGNADTIWFDWDQKNQILTVLDNGRGMDSIGRLFQLGNTIGVSPNDIGLYGSGGTKALLWLAEIVEIWSLRDGKVQHDVVEWDEWIKAKNFDDLGVSDEWVKASLANTPTELFELGHGVMIRMTLDGAKRKINPSHMRRDLALLYAPGLRKGKKLFWRTRKGATVVDETWLTDPFARDAAPHSRRFDFTIEHETKDGKVHHLPVRGVVYYDKTTTQTASVLHVGFGFRRMFTTRDCYHGVDGVRRTGIGVYGYIDLGHGWQSFLAVTKDGINNAYLYERLMAYLFQQIKPLLEKADSETIDIELEDIALGLQAALQWSPSAKIEVSASKGKGFKREGEDGGIPPDEPQPGPKRDDDANVADPKGERKTKQPPAVSLMITREDDSVMERNLCRAAIEGTEKNLQIMITVNEDHAAVQEALVAKPINRIALNFLVIAELAAVLMEKDDGRLVKAMLGQEWETIEDRDDGHDRVRLLTRLLMNRVRTPAFTVVAEAA